MCARRTGRKRGSVEPWKRPPAENRKSRDAPRRNFAPTANQKVRPARLVLELEIISAVGRMNESAPLLGTRSRALVSDDPLKSVPRPPALLQLPVQVVVRGQEHDVLRDGRAAYAVTTSALTSPTPLGGTPLASDPPPPFSAVVVAGARAARCRRSAGAHPLNPGPTPCPSAPASPVPPSPGTRFHLDVLFVDVARFSSRPCPPSEALARSRATASSTSPPRRRRRQAGVRTRHRAMLLGGRSGAGDDGGGAPLLPGAIPTRGEYSPPPLPRVERDERVQRAAAPAGFLRVVDDAPHHDRVARSHVLEGTPTHPR